MPQLNTLYTGLKSGEYYKIVKFGVFEMGFLGVDVNYLNKKGDFARSFAQGGAKNAQKLTKVGTNLTKVDMILTKSSKNCALLYLVEKKTCAFDAKIALPKLT